MILSAAALLLTSGTQAQTVFRCTDANGKVLYANSPCPSTNPKQEKRLSGDSLKGNVVQMPKAPPPAEEKKNPIAVLKQEPIDIDDKIKEGDPKQNQERKPAAIEKMKEKLDDAKKQMERTRQDIEKLWKDE